jgi:hypothetical protein
MGMSSTSAKFIKNSFAFLAVITLVWLGSTPTAMAKESSKPMIPPWIQKTKSLPMAQSALSFDLSILSSRQLPILELSAFAAVSGQDPLKSGFIAVGDRDPLLWRTNRFPGANNPSGPSSMGSTLDLRQSMGFLLSECRENSSKFCKKTLEGLSAQWEGAAFDQDQRLWLLQESTESVHIFDSTLSRRQSIINLEAPKLAASSDSIPQSYIAKENNMYEGIHVLSKEQFLLAKQTSPSAIVLFEVQDSIVKEESIPLVQKAQVLKAWQLPISYKDCALNELTTFEDELYLLSGSCQKILKVSLDRNEDSITVHEVYSYPSQLKQGEALLVLGRGKFILGLDTGKKPGDNLFILDLPPEFKRH